MKIFLPSQNPHAYLQEVQRYSVNSYHFRELKSFDPSLKIVNIHWPEELFNWYEPSVEELEKLERIIEEWKTAAKIVYTKHDVLRTKGNTPLFNRLYKIIEKNTDVFIHLGEFSRDFYQDKYPYAKHEIIYHPLYKNSFKKYEKEEARKKLGIDKKAIVVIAPGNIRHSVERQIVLKAFRKLNIKNKILICTNMRNELGFNFPGRVRLQKVFDVQKFVKERFITNHQPPDYIFNYSPMSAKEISLRMSAADVVLVPRIELLNSGIVFLGASYDKVVVGPRTGNITEQLEEQNLPVFNPYSISSVTEALSEGVELYLNGNFHWKNMEKYQPEFVAKEYDRIFSEILIHGT